MEDELRWRRVWHWMILCQLLRTIRPMEFRFFNDDAPLWWLPSYGEYRT